MALCMCFGLTAQLGQLIDSLGGAWAHLQTCWR